jgi:hypothetical protein
MQLASGRKMHLLREDLLYAAGERAEDALATRRTAVCSWRAGGRCTCYEKNCSMQLASGWKMALIPEDLLCAAGERLEKSERMYDAIAIAAHN